MLSYCNYPGSKFKVQAGAKSLPVPGIDLLSHSSILAMRKEAIGKGEWNLLNENADE